MKFANLPFLSKLSVVSATVILAAGPVRGAPLDAVRWADVPLGQPGQPDGLTADAKGNIYAASFTLTSNFQPPFNNNIYVWNPNGQLLSTTPLPSQAVPLGNTEVTAIITKIKQVLPKGGVIYNTLNGDSNVKLKYNECSILNLCLR